MCVRTGIVLNATTFGYWGWQIYSPDLLKSLAIAMHYKAGSQVMQANF